MLNFTVICKRNLSLDEKNKNKNKNFTLVIEKAHDFMCTNGDG